MERFKNRVPKIGEIRQKHVNNTLFKTYIVQTEIEIEILKENHDQMNKCPLDFYHQSDNPKKKLQNSLNFVWRSRLLRLNGRKRQTKFCEFYNFLCIDTLMVKI